MIFALGQIGIHPGNIHVNQRMIKVGYMFHIHNEAAMGLKELRSREVLCPVLDRMGGLIIPVCSVDNTFLGIGLNGNNGR